MGVDQRYGAIGTGSGSSGLSNLLGGFPSFPELLQQQYQQQVQPQGWGQYTTAYPPILAPALTKRSHFYRVNEKVGYNEGDLMESPVDRLRIKAARWLDGN